MRPIGPKLLQLLEDHHGHIALVSESELAVMLRLLGARRISSELRVPLLAETWLRQWLYIGEFVPPDEFRAIYAQFSPEFRTAFVDLAQPWRTPRLDGNPLPSLEPPAVKLEVEESAVWECFWGRLRNFVCCHGIVALVWEREGAGDQEAVVAPFELRLNGASEISDGAQERIEVWSKAVGWLKDDYEHSLAAVVNTVVPPPEQQNIHETLKGESIALAILLARERERGATLPEFYPLDVLATGGFRAGRLQPVGGLSAKAALAKRLGCRFFFRPENGAKDDGGLPVETPLADLFPLVGKILSGTRENPAVLRRALSFSQKRIASPKASLHDAAEVFRRLIRVEPAFVGRPIANDCRVLIREAAVRMKIASFATVDRQVALLVQEYQRRPFHGRQSTLEAVDKFLGGPGGILLVTGAMGYGKTALMAEILQRHLPEDCIVFRHFFSLHPHYVATCELNNFHRQVGLFLAAILGDDNLQRDYEEGDIVTLFEKLSEIPLARKVVLVLDGIDEAKEILRPHYLRQMPKGAYVIAAIRTSGTDEPARYLEPWTELDHKSLDIGKLSDDGLRIWLEQNRSEALKFLSASTRFRELLLTRAGGCPRYIGDVIETLERVTDLQTSWEQRLSAVPEEYADFVRMQYRQMKAETKEFDDTHESFFGLLCAAEGDLSVPEIRRVLGKMPRLPGECERWLSVCRSTDGAGDQYALQTPQMRDALRTVVPWREEEQKLIRLCQSWADPRMPDSTYSLRYFATHLRENWTAIAAFVLDSRYRPTVARCFPDESDLPLKVLRDGLALAIDKADWKGVACLMLARARLRNQMLNYQERSDLPLETMTQQTAEVLSHFDLGRTALMRLLTTWILIWKKKAENDIEEARHRLAGQRLAMLNGLEADVAVELLFRAFQADDQRLPQIAERLLDEEARRDLVGKLAGLKTSEGFAAARRVLQVFPKTRRNQTNPHYDKAVNALTVGLAAANRWAEVIELSERQLQRQATLNLVEAGRVAARNGQKEVLKEMRTVMNRIIASCVTPAELARRNISAQQLPSWEGTPKDLVTCLSNRARLDAMIGFATGTLEKAAPIWEDVFEQAKTVPPEQRFHALRELVFLVVEAGARPGFESIFAPADEREPSLLARAIYKADEAWVKMSANENVSFLASAHATAKLLRLGEEIGGAAPLSVPGLFERIKFWREKLTFGANMLNAEDRDRLWLRVASEATEGPHLDIDWALFAMGNIDDFQLSHRAVAKLVRRLYDEGRGREADDLGNRNGRIQQPVSLARGLSTLDFRKDMSSRQLFIRCQPRISAYSVQLVVLKGELAVVLRLTDPKGSNRFMSEAEETLSRYRARAGVHSRIRFQLNLASAAFRANEHQLAERLLRVATDEAFWEANRVESSWARSKVYRPAIDDALSQSDYVEAIDSLCAVALAQKQINPDWDNPFPAWKWLWEFAHSIAKEMVPGISSRTGALAEVAEAAKRLQLMDSAEGIFKEMHRFTQDALNRFGSKKIRREKEACLGELLLGLLKANVGASSNLVQDAKAELLFAEIDASGRKKRRELSYPVSLHAMAWLCVREFNLGGAWPYLNKIKDASEKAKAARDMAISLTHQKGGWKKIPDVIGFIQRGELKQKYLHKIVEALLLSKHTTAMQKKTLFGELLPACADNVDSTLATLAHIVRYNAEAGLGVAQGLMWAESYGVLE